MSSQKDGERQETQRRQSDTRRDAVDVTLEQLSVCSLLCNMS